MPPVRRICSDRRESAADISIQAGFLQSAPKWESVSFSCSPRLFTEHRGGRIGQVEIANPFVSLQQIRILQDAPGQRQFLIGACIVSDENLDSVGIEHAPHIVSPY